MDKEYTSNVYKFAKIMAVSCVATMVVFFAFGNKIDCNCETVQAKNELELKIDKTEIPETDTFLKYH